jgi:hypothetical protein
MDDGNEAARERRRAARAFTALAGFGAPLEAAVEAEPRERRRPRAGPGYAMISLIWICGWMFV